MLTTNAQEDPRFGGQNSVISHNLRSILCVPLKVREKLTGVIYADNRIRAGIFTDVEKELLATFANHAAVALENARLFESVSQTLAEVCELKGLMDNVFASIASGVITTDNEQIISLCNMAAGQILGRSGRELVGLTLEEAFAPYLSAMNEKDFLSELGRIQKTGASVVGKELSLILPERDPITVSFNLSPLRDTNQETQGIAIVMDDLTEKNACKLEHAFLNGWFRRR